MVRAGCDTHPSETMDLVTLFESATTHLALKAASILAKWMGIIARWISEQVRAVYASVDAYLDGTLAA